MVHDSEHYRRRAAEARSAAFCRDEDDGAQAAGQLALAYSALARRRARAAEATAEQPLLLSTKASPAA